MADATSSVIIDVSVNAADARSKAEALAQSLQTLQAAQRQLRASGEQLSAQYVENAQKIRQLTAEQKAYVALSQSAIGSNNALRAQLGILTAQYNALSAAERDGTKQGQLLQKQIRSISDELKRNESAVGDNRRNVGNYTGALGLAAQAGVPYASSLMSITQGLNSLSGAFTSIGTAAKAYQTATELATAATIAQNQIITEQIALDAAQTAALEAETAAQAAQAEATATAASAEVAKARFDAENIGLQEAMALSLEVTTTAQIAETAAINANNASEAAAIAANTEMIATQNLQAVSAEATAAAYVAETAAVEATTAALTILKTALIATGVGALLVIIGSLGAFLTKLDGVSDGIGQFKSRVGGAFAEIGRQASEAFSDAGVLGVLQRFTIGLNGVRNASVAAGKEMERFAEIFQNFEDIGQVNENDNQVIQNQVQLLRIQARNIKLSNDQKQALLDQANNLEENAATRTKSIHASIIAETVEFADKSIDYRGNLNDEQKKLLNEGDLQLANSLLNDNKISRDAYAKLREAYKLRNSDAQQANLQLEKIANDKDKYDQRNQLKEKERAAQLEAIAQDRIKSAGNTAAAVLGIREKEYQYINTDIEKRKALYIKNGADTTNLESERLARITALHKKFTEENEAFVQANIRAAQLSDIKSGAVTIGKDQPVATQLHQQQQIYDLQDIDKQIKDYQDRVINGEQGLNDSIDALLKKREAIIHAGNLQQVTDANDTQSALKGIQDQRAQLADDEFRHIQDGLAAEQDAANKKMEINQQLLDSYGSLFDTIGGLVDRNSAIAKVAFAIEKGFAIARVVIAANEARAKIAFATSVAIAEAEAASFVTFGASLLAIPGFIASGAEETAAVTVGEVASIASIVGAVIQDVAGHAQGGPISGPGSSTSDSIPARLSNGEFVMTASATKQYGGLLSAMNMSVGGKGFATGGFAGSFVPTLSNQINNSNAVATALASSIKGVRNVVYVEDINYQQSKSAVVVENGNW